MKWHHKFAYGPEGSERWLDLRGCTTKEEAEVVAKEERLELASEYAWSDNDRGIDYEIVDLPPASVLRDLVKDSTRKILAWTEQDKYLRGLLAEAEERETKAS